jgi:hypothetical protein
VKVVEDAMNGFGVVSEPSAFWVDKYVAGIFTFTCNLELIES